MSIEGEKTVLSTDEVLSVRRIIDEAHIYDCYERAIQKGSLRPGDDNRAEALRWTLKDLCKSIHKQIVWGIYGNQGKLEKVIYPFKAVERLTEKDCKNFKTLYVKGVAEIPENFGSTFEDIRDTSTIVFRKFLKGNYVVGVKYEYKDTKGKEKSALIGMVNIQREKGTRSHRAKLGGLYVAKGHRGRGLAANMTINALDHTLTVDNGDIKITELVVTATNKFVIDWYERLGFQRGHVEYNAAIVNGVSYDWQHMSLDMKTYAEKREEIKRARP